MTRQDISVDNYRSTAGARAVQDRYRALLDLWPVANQQRTVPTRAGPTFVVSSGPEDAPAVLALQGSAANTARWLPQIVPWAQHLRIHADHDQGVACRQHVAARIENIAPPGLFLDDLAPGLIDVPNQLVAVNHVQKKQPHTHAAKAQEDARREHHDPVI